MIRKKVFIAGRLNRNAPQAQKERFKAMAKELGKDQSFVFPTVYAEPLATWEDSIRSDISNLMHCSDLHMLSGWQGHKRSEILRDTALRIGIHVHYH